MIGFPKYDPSEPLPDSGETIQISPLALLKMLRHGRAGVPVEVMGLMLGRRIDDYTTEIVDVYAMPQTGTGVTVEAVDPVYQTQMNEALEMVGRKENVVGWYHSHPGFGCWLSHVDMATQGSFEQLNKNAIAVVIDPIQSVKGKVVLDAFRLINPTLSMTGIEPRQVTSNIGFTTKPTPVSLLHGVGKYYYNFRITYKKNELEQKMLLALNKKSWAESLKVEKAEDLLVDFRSLTKNYLKNCDEEERLEGKELEMHRVGKVDYRRKILEECDKITEKIAKRNLLLAMHGYIFGNKK